MRKLTVTLCLTIAVLLGSVGMSASADFQTGLTAYKSGDYVTALREFRPLAEQGDANVQFQIGWMYYKGQGVPQDYKTALKWYTLAAEQGNVYAQTFLGSMHGVGEGTRQDYKTALKWYTLAAEQGNRIAQVKLGDMYAEGVGVPQDYKIAVKWYKFAAEQGDASAQSNLGGMYANGYGVPRDDNLALKWWTLAAKQGKAKAQSNLGVMYQFGIGVSQNYEEAARWYELAANQGNSTAQKQLGAVYVSLGKMLRENNVTCKNLNACGEALEFYYKAAELGNGDAMILIPNVLMFLNENTMSEIDKLKNKQKMVMWWILGMEVGNTDPELTKNTEVVLNDIKKQSTLFAIGEKLARECVRKNYKGC